MLPALAVLAVVTALAYLPGLSGGFIFDDVANIVHNRHLAIEDLRASTLWQAAASGESGPLRRPVSMLSFALNVYLTGMDPYWFKVGNLVIHIASAIGIYLLTSLLLRAYLDRHGNDRACPSPRLVALAVAAAWALHPINLTPVLYIVQRMTSLAALFTVWALVMYVLARLRLEHDPRGALVLLVGAMLSTVLGVLSKENAVLAPAYMLVIESMFFRFSTRSTGGRWSIIGFHLLMVGLPLALLAAFLVWNPGWLGATYQHREFDLSERLLTEARVLWSYIGMVLIPLPGQFGLYHDDLQLSTGAFHPATTLFAVAGLAGLAAAAILMRRAFPLVSFAVLFFLVGHSLESGPLGLELMHEHRNYLPSYGILFALLFYLLGGTQTRLPVNVGRLAAFGFIAVLALVTGSRAFYWGNPLTLALAEVRHHPASPRANYEAGVVYARLMTMSPADADELYRAARQHFETAAGLRSTHVAGLFAMIRLDAEAGRSTPVTVLRELRERLSGAVLALNTNDSFRSLVACLKDKVCVMKESDFEGLVAATLSNPTTSRNMAAAVLLSRVDYHLHVTGNRDKALSAARQVVRRAPGRPNHRLELAALLIGAGRFEEAREQLTAAGKADSPGLFSERISDLERTLKRGRSLGG